MPVFFQHSCLQNITVFFFLSISKMMLLNSIQLQQKPTGWPPAKLVDLNLKTWLGKKIN